MTLIMSSEIGGGGASCLHDNIRLGDKNNLVVFSAIKLFFFYVLYFIQDQ